MRRLSLLVLALLTAALALTACGGGSSGSGSAEDVLRSTFGPNRPVKSGRLALALDLDAKGLGGLNGPIAIKLAGPFESRGGKTLPAFGLRLNLTSGGQTLTAGATSTGTKGYLTLAGRNFDVGDQLYRQLSQGYGATSTPSKDSKQPTLKQLGIDPLRWLKDPKKAGEEQVGGATTEHVTAGVDVGRLLDDVDTLLGKASKLNLQGATGQQIPTGISAAQRSAISRSVKDARFDVWSGTKDHTLRRLALNVSFDVPADARKDAGGLQSGALKLDLTIADLNQDQTITAPKGARPLSDLIAALQGGAAPSAAAGTGGATGGAGASGGGAAPSSAYLKCLQDAGSDIAKVQACATLVGK